MSIRHLFQDNECRRISRDWIKARVAHLPEELQKLVLEGVIRRMKLRCRVMTSM